MGLVILQSQPSTFAMTETVVKALNSFGPPRLNLYIEFLVSTELDLENEQWVFQQSPLITKNVSDAMTRRKGYGYGPEDVKIYDIDARVARATWYLIVHTFGQGVRVETLSWKGFKLQFAVVTDSDFLTSLISVGEVPLQLNKAQAFLVGTNYPSAKQKWVDAYHAAKPAIERVCFVEDENSFGYDEPIEPDLSNAGVLITLQHSQVIAAAHHYDYKPPFGDLYPKFEPKTVEGKVDVIINDEKISKIRIGTVSVFLFHPHPKFDTFSSTLRVMAAYNIPTKVRVYETYYGRVLVDVCEVDFQ